MESKVETGLYPLMETLPGAPAQNDVETAPLLEPLHKESKQGMGLYPLMETLLDVPLQNATAMAPPLEEVPTNTAPPSEELPTNTTVPSHETNLDVPVIPDAGTGIPLDPQSSQVTCLFCNKNQTTKVERVNRNHAHFIALLLGLTLCGAGIPLLIHFL